MSYYKGSGYGSRGGYRGGSSSGYRGGGGGSGNGESWRGGRGGSSSFSSQRAVGGSSSAGGSSRYYGSSPPSSSYESRSRSYVGGGSSSDRYSSRREESYSRYQDLSSYGSRDYGRSGSPEPPRKRVREGSPYMGGRRSHDRSFTASGGADYSSRVGAGASAGFYEKGSSSGGGGSLGAAGGGGGGGGYLSEKGTYREVRESSRPAHHAPSSSANDYPTFRKPSFSSPRGGGFRASRRGLRSARGAGAAFRHSSSAAYLSRKRLLAESAYHLRRKGLATRSSYLRRLKQYRLLKSRYSSRAERKKREAEEAQDGEDDDKDGEIMPDDDDDEEDDEVLEVGSSQDEEDGQEEEEEEEGTAEGDELKNVDAKRGEPIEIEEGEVEGGDEEVKEKQAGDSSNVVGGEEKDANKEKDTKEKKDSVKDGSSASPKKENKKKKKVSPVIKKSTNNKKSSKTADDKNNDDTKGEESGGEGKDGDKKPALTNFLGQPYIKLKCPHCHFACVTFKEYSRHLDSTKHLAAMNALSAKLRKSFSTMRLEQRKMQKVLDEEAKSLNMRLRTVFCNICKLNYRTLKSQHHSSAAHKKMREFQTPYCRVCRIGFKSSWAYDVHICELQHIKRKARAERLSKPPGNKDIDEDINLDTNNFMVLDAVGSGDESEAEKSETEAPGEKSEEVKEKKETVSAEKKKKEKKEIKLGSEYCKLVEVYFCELCKIYLPRFDDKERALTSHCRSRTHLQRYIRSRDDRNLRRKAVKLHKEREKLREKEKEKKNIKEDKVKDDMTGSNGAKLDEGDSQTAAEISEGKKNGGDVEDKSWSEDKELSDLINDELEEGEKQSDDEDEEEEEDDDDEDGSKEGERYDRFRHSDKDGTTTKSGGGNSSSGGGTGGIPAAAVGNSGQNSSSADDGVVTVEKQQQQQVQQQQQQTGVIKGSKMVVNNAGGGGAGGGGGTNKETTVLSPSTAAGENTVSGSTTTNGNLNEKDRSPLHSTV